MTTPESLTLDDLTFEIRWSTRRKTVGVTVDRDGQLILHAPTDLPTSEIEMVARDKQMWVYTTLARKEALQHPHRSRDYLPGEGFYYLGRSHRLRLIDDTSATAPLRLHQGWFELQHSRRPDARRLFISWYRVRAQAFLERRVAPAADRIGRQPTTISVKSLGNRWGSCSKAGTLSFHWRTVLLPSRIVEYIIVHELAHLHEHHHNAMFWDRIERAMPDWRQRADWLARHGAEYDL